MALKYRIVERKIPGGSDKGKTKYYAIPASGSALDLNYMAEKIANRSCFHAIDIKMFLEHLKEAIREELQDGRPVRLDGFGTFRLSLVSDGADSYYEFNKKYIQDVKINFLPDQSIKPSFGSMSFTQALHIPDKIDLYPQEVVPWKK